MSLPVPPEGMSSDALAEHVRLFIIACQERVHGPGKAQYSTERGQAFEQMGLAQIVQEARDELLDIANYAAMLDIHLGRLAQKIHTIAARENEP